VYLLSFGTTGFFAALAAGFAAGFALAAGFFAALAAGFAAGLLFVAICGTPFCFFTALVSLFYAY
jgi:hypothetical protein